MTLTLRLIIMDPTSEGDDSNTKTHNNGPYVRGRQLTLTLRLITMTLTLRLTVMDPTSED